MLEGSFFYDKNFLKIPEVTNKQTNKVIEIDVQYGPKVTMAIITL